MADEIISPTNIAVWSLLAGAIGGAINSMIAGLINYRKTRDAGQLEIVKAEQANQSAKLTELEKHRDDCEDKLLASIQDRASLRGELIALKHIVLKDTQATDDLRSSVAVLSSRIEGNP